MYSDGSVTRLLDGLHLGNPEAVEQLWQRYFHRLVGLARKRLDAAPRRVADEEDIALSAFKSFCLNAEKGHFPELLDRDGLWRLLMTITLRKAGQLLRHENRQKRGGGLAPKTGEDSAPPVIEELLSQEPSPEAVTAATEEYDRLLAMLGSEELRQVAVRRMEGYSVEEIAQELNCVPRSVKRRLNLIRKVWLQEVDQ